MVVAGVALGAELAQLLGAHTAAAAAVEHQGDAGGAGGARPRSALALPAALLALSLLQVPGGTQRETEGTSEPPPGPPGRGRRGGRRGRSTYRAEEGEQQGDGPRDQGAGDHPAAVSGLRGARWRRRAGSGVGLPGGEWSRGEPRASRRADLLGGADGAAAGAVPEGGCWVLHGSALLAPSECGGRVAV